MGFRLAFGTANADFSDNPEIAVARILRELANRIEGSYHKQDLVEQKMLEGKIRDVNGNTIGDWEWDDDSDERVSVAMSDGGDLDEETDHLNETEFAARYGDNDEDEEDEEEYQKFKKHLIESRVTYSCRAAAEDAIDDNDDIDALEFAIDAMGEYEPQRVYSYQYGVSGYLDRYFILESDSGDFYWYFAQAEGEASCKASNLKAAEEMMARWVYKNYL